MNTNIRVAQPADAPAILGLVIELGYANDLLEIQDRLAFLCTLPEHRLLVAEVEGHVVGLLHAAVSHQIESPSHVQIVALIVSEKLRSQGIGPQLVAAAESWAQAQGLHELRVRVNTKRVRTQAFYRRNGFDELKEQKTLGKRLSAPAAS